VDELHVQVKALTDTNFPYNSPALRSTLYVCSSPHSFWRFIGEFPVIWVSCLIRGHTRPAAWDLAPLRCFFPYFEATFDRLFAMGVTLNRISSEEQADYFFFFPGNCQGLHGNRNPIPPYNAETEAMVAKMHVTAGSIA